MAVKTGLDAYRIIVADAAHLLRKGGRIALEIGYDQAVDFEKPVASSWLWSRLKSLGICRATIALCCAQVVIISPF